MKKIAKIILIILGFAALIILGIYLYITIKQKSKIYKLPAYYQTLAKECESKQNYNCCISSVINMADKNYKLVPKIGCPEGYRPTGLKCIDSFSWCEPKNQQNVSQYNSTKLSEEEKYCLKNGGKIGERVECGKKVSICTLKDSTDCAIDEYFKGLCKEGFIVEWGEGCRL